MTKGETWRKEWPEGVEAAVLKRKNVIKEPMTIKVPGEH
jgi:hypothetical protein